MFPPALRRPSATSEVIPAGRSSRGDEGPRADERGRHPDGTALPGDRRHRVHRRPARAGTAGRGAPGALSGPLPREAARPPVGGPCRGGGRGRDGRRVASRRDARTSTWPTTWCTRWAPARDFEETDRSGGADLRRAGPGRRGAADRLPRRAHAARACPRRTVAASALAGRGGPHPAGLRACPTTVLRAAVVIGSGSASFEMLRYLTERLPVMVTPSWVRTRIQPMAVRDVLRSSSAAPRMPAEVEPGLRHRRVPTC